MAFTRYENQICEISPAIPEADEYCFSVLSRILRGVCRLTVTDGERLIVCHSAEPYPVWVWQTDGASDEELEMAYLILKREFGFEGSYRFNVKHSMAKYLIDRAARDGFDLGIHTNMLAYSCPDPIPPKRPVKGEYRAAESEDIPIASEYMRRFHDEMNIDRTDMAAYVKRATELIAEGRLFFWYDELGERAAMASYGISGDKGSIGNVFTLPDKRRRGYAAGLVYALTLMIRDLGKIPTLYTDADYAASNACYEGIGYRSRGSLCTVG